MKPIYTKLSEINFLLIDDDPDDRMFFNIALKKVPFPIHYLSASDGRKGLDLLATSTHKPQYIFLDLNMPLLSGKQCLTRIRQIPGFENVPIVIFSTSSYHGDIEECQKLGASHFFTKVHKVQTLTDTISKLISGIELPFVLNSPTP
ncbi:response regulator [Algoriphagus resistens]|uniref:response regulator n=1 Tax=Algoriphagus resistens TaxID=1750590 RepID=UPI0007168279|nr:response regulator [Algoriphagus resistens]